MKYIIEPSDAFHLYQIQTSKIHFLDCQFQLADPLWGEEQYRIRHLPHATYFGLEKDLSGPITPHGGRHPLPNWTEFIGKLEEKGISNQNHVIVYDQGDGSYASRLWWMLTYLGMEKVSVLNGGIDAWTKEGYPVTTEMPQNKKTVFIPSFQTHMLAEMKQVQGLSKEKESGYLIDSRTEERYLGTNEPIDVKAGHIPKALNRNWTEGLKDGKFLSLDAQVERFKDLDNQKQKIVYCGSGVTATPNVLSLMEAGHENVKLYAGSFSDWISYEENPIVKKPMK
jgi:thiosulfate/3-mercaptopyruvate sulfurtransferase